MTNEIKATSQNELSADINVITAEINAYQRVAGEAIFEIGRRLKHVKENDLAHGEFGKWLDEVGINQRVAQQMMKVVTELSDSKTRTSSHLGMEALYQIATLPPEQRESEHVTSKGETKKPDEMTVKELRELKRQLKETEQAKEQAEQSAEIERRERERLEEENAELIAEQMSKEEEEEEEAYDEPETESIESRTPYGAKLGQAMYGALRELSEWQKEYSWIITDANEFRKMYEADANFAREFTRVREFWKQLEMAVGRNEGSTVVDADFSVIN